MTLGQGPKEPRGGEGRIPARTQTAFGGSVQTLAVGLRSTADARVFPNDTVSAGRYSFAADATAPPSVPVPASTRVLEPELEILQYEVIKELGRGGMGVVYLARDNRLARKVAIKLLQNSHPEFTRRFIIEARATARCGHENIVVIYEVGEFRGSPFMVLEYLKGQTLAALLEKSPVLPPGRAVELMVSVVRALACAHAQGIVHRDLKPENIFLQETGTLKVLDFGIAKVLEIGHSLPESRRELARATLFGVQSGEEDSETGIAGTMAYMSPEQWGVGGPIDHHTDIWTTGVILFELLSGVHPLVVVNADPRLWVARLDLPMPSLRQVAPQVPEALANVVDRCLSKDQSARFPDAVALLRELEPFLPGRGTSNVIHADRGPYAGLRSFQEDDAARFFGRSREIAEMAMRIRDYPLSAVVGASGVGKSSFIRAGVVPSLKGSGENWDVLVARPGREPLLALAALLSPLVGTSPTLVADLGAQAELAQRLLREPGYFGSVLRLDARRAGRRILLFVDQFEELYTQNADLALRRAFTACLSAAADDVTSPVRVVVSIRADFLARAAEDPQFMNDLAKGMLVLPPPTAEGLRDALVQPAALAGYRFENEAMVDEMVRHLEAAPGALPLVQFTAAQLWEKRDVTRRALTQAHYDAIGGIAGALVSHADRVIAKLANEALVRSVFVNLVTAERTRAVRLLSELYEIGGDPAEIRRLIEHLVESRLLVVQRGAGEGDATVEVIHESLIAAWPALRRWLDESHGDSLFAEQLRAAARQWHVNRHDSGLLWGGEMVDELERFQQRFRGEFSPMTQAFVSAVFELRARGTRRRRRFAAAGASLVVGLLAAAAVTVVVVRKAQKEAESNAVIATRNGAEAQRRLREVEAKEKERIREETRRQAAERDATAAHGQVQLSNAQLADKNEAVVTLARAEQQRSLAVSAQGRAVENEQAARSAEERAKDSAAELEKLLARERERTSRLTAQLGSLVEKLP